MIHSIDAIITKNGNVVKTCARIETVVKYLKKQNDIENYEVISPTFRESGKRFLEIYSTLDNESRGNHEQ